MLPPEVHHMQVSRTRRAVEPQFLYAMRAVASTCSSMHGTSHPRKCCWLRKAGPVPAVCAAGSEADRVGVQPVGLLLLADQAVAGQQGVPVHQPGRQGLQLRRVQACRRALLLSSPPGGQPAYVTLCSRLLLGRLIHTLRLRQTSFRNALPRMLRQTSFRNALPRMLSGTEWRWSLIVRGLAVLGLPHNLAFYSSLAATCSCRQLMLGRDTSSTGRPPRTLQRGVQALKRPARTGEPAAEHSQEEGLHNAQGDHQQQRRAHAALPRRQQAALRGERGRLVRRHALCRFVLHAAPLAARARQRCAKAVAGIKGRARITCKAQQWQYMSAPEHRSPTAAAYSSLYVEVDRERFTALFDQRRVGTRACATVPLIRRTNVLYSEQVRAAVCCACSVKQSGPGLDRQRLTRGSLRGVK